MEEKLEKWVFPFCERSTTTTGWRELTVLDNISLITYIDPLRKDIIAFNIFGWKGESGFQYL